MNRIILSSILFFFSMLIYGQETVCVSSFGLKPNSRENATPYVRKAIEACRSKENVILSFPVGRYDFWPQHCIEKEYYESNTTDNNPKRLAMLFEGMRNITLDGNGSEFIMHDRIQPITSDVSENVTLKNFVIDWDIPLMAQGQVAAVGSDYFDLKIDSCKYPFILEDGKFIFTGEGWKSGIRSMIAFDADNHIIQHGDYALGKGWKEYKTKMLNEDLLRVSKEGGFASIPKQGNIIVLRHSARDHAGIFILDSKNIVLENITIHHTAGLGILGQYSENISFDNVNVVPNEQKGRYFSGHDDGFHIMGCKGLIKVNNCEWKGLMDDPINIHGTCVKITEVLSPSKVKCKFMEIQSKGMQWAVNGDNVGLIDEKTMNTIEQNNVHSFTKLNTEEFILEFTRNFAKGVRNGMALENLTWTPDVDIRNSRFLSCRARGLLVSTPGKVVVENNVFESSGSAILIAGDANYWYETGAVKDVLIKNNTFNYQCLSSMYQFTEGIISILPEIPKPDPNKPYHRNIRIEGNTFNPFDYPILYAKSVDGLFFNNNVINRSYRIEPFHQRKSGISLDACKNVKILNNIVGKDVLGKNISIENMNKREIELSKKSPFYFDK